MGCTGLHTHPHASAHAHTCTHTSTHVYVHTQRFTEGLAFCFRSAFPTVLFPSPGALQPAQGRRRRGAWSAWAAIPSSQPAGHLGGFWKEPAGAGGPLGILMELAGGGARTQETQTCHPSQAHVGPRGLGSHPGAQDVLRCGLWLHHCNGAAVPSFPRTWRPACTSTVTDVTLLVQDSR